ncbi:hypothetical protein OAI46_04525 [Alphaproteobacteria bacterium]|nr:hypothetical protein [Alphaproteobacteria bacterium]MDC0148111.1 hypothetical protein [Alphaproteobacteria bacterium]
MTGKTSYEPGGAFAFVRNLNETLSEIIRPAAVLKPSSAGFGDILTQINRFLWAGDFYNYRSKIFFDAVNHRNEETVQGFFEALNITKLNILTDRFKHSRAYGCPSFVDVVSGYRPPFSKAYFDFGRGQKNQIHWEPELKKRFSEQHPRLLEAIRESKIYKRMMVARGAKTKRKICVHVRRGDTALVEASLLEAIIKKEIDPNHVLHPRGIFTRSSIQEEVPDVFLKRYKPMEDYKLRLEKVLSDSSQDTEVVLISDGMTKLAGRLKTRHNHIFKNPEISEHDVERHLEKEFDTLLPLVNSHWIGERGTFWESLIQAASSDIVISKSPAFIKRITMGLDFDIQYVRP